MWGVAMDVSGWLRDLGLGQYETNFRDNKINADLLRPDTLQVGVRRISTNKPNVQLNTWAYQFEAPACRDLVGGQGNDGFEEVLNFLKNTVVCPLEAVGNLYQALTLPVRNFLLWLFDEVVFDIQSAVEVAITAAVVDDVANAENDSNVVKLMTTSLQTVVNTPSYLINDAPLKAAITPIAQPWLNMVRILTGKPVAQCGSRSAFWL
jgi:hypothetical protein